MVGLVYLGVRFVYMHKKKIYAFVMIETGNYIFGRQVGKKKAIGVKEEIISKSPRLLLTSGSRE